MASYTQEQRHLRLTTALGPDKLLLERMSGEEAISVPFLLTLDLLSEDPGIMPGALLRTPACASVEAPGGPRVFHGMVRRFVQLDRTEDGLTRYRMEMVPWLWFLSLSRDCRIFQNKSVPDIVAEVFRDLGFSDFENRCTTSYSPREYCVQYRETHLDFVSRLLEEEGIFYFFEHGEEKHTLVLADAPSAIVPCPGQASAKLADHPGMWHDEDVVTSLVLESAAQTGKVVLNDYNFTTPSANLLAQLPGASSEELFDYPGMYGVRPDGDRYARLLLEEREALRDVVHGDGTCRHFVPGYRVDIKGHYRRDANAAYLITRVHHEAGSGGYRGGMGADDFDYRNSFTCIPHATPFRPPRATPRPVVHGTQTAIVVGPAGEEIYVDKYGRVKVQFHWDRRGKKNENSSCWVRVSSTWAGKNWGFVQLPRIGQEVVVDFLEGDPDLPIITGRVYNAEQMPPYALPANATQSGLKTRSSKGGTGENFNELRFEDKKGSEEVYLHAEKDWNTVVENDRTLDVGHDETITVKNDRKKTVDGNETVLVKKDRTETVNQNEKITIDLNRTELVKGDEAITVNGKRTEKVDKAEKVEIGDKREVSIGTTEKLDVGTSRTVSVGTSDALDVGTSLEVSAAQSITLKANQEIVLQCGGSSIKLTPTGIEITGAATVKMAGGAQVDISGGAQVGIKGAMVMIN